MEALTLINQLKEYYNSDRFHFDMNISMFLSGPHNKGLRVEVMQAITGQKLPATKCGLHAVSDALKNSFEQLTMF